MQDLPLEIPAFKTLEEAMTHLKGLYLLGYTAKQVATAVVHSELIQGKPVRDVEAYVPEAIKVYESMFQELWDSLDNSNVPLDAYLMAQEYERLRTKLAYMMHPHEDFLKNIREEIDDITQ